MKTTFGVFGAFLVLAFSGTPVVAASGDQQDPAVVSNGDGYFVVWADQRNQSLRDWDIYGARVSASGELLDREGIAICTAPGIQWFPQVAFDGQNYLVVWEDDRESTANYLLYQIYGARVTTDGRVLEPNGFAITTNRITRNGAAVASNGRGFFAIWTDWHRTEGVIADVYGSPISSEGVVANPDGIPLVLGEFWQTAGNIASANGEYLLTALSDNQLVGLRVSSDGDALSDVFPLGGGSGAGYGLASNGRDYFAVWGDGRTTSNALATVYGTLIRSNGTVANFGGIPVATDALYQTTPSVASDGNDFLVVWSRSDEQSGASADIFGAKVTSEGVLGVPARIAINQSRGSQGNPDLAFNGRNFLVAWQDARNAPDVSSPWGSWDIYGTLVSGAGVVSDSNGVIISALDGPPLPPPPAPDRDNDGVPDDRDACLGTAPGAIVNAQGCSIAQLCPCEITPEGEGPWSSHRAYVNCVRDATAAFEQLGLITARQRQAIIVEASRSDCGKKSGR